MNKQECCEKCSQWHGVGSCLDANCPCHQEPKAISKEEWLLPKKFRFIAMNYPEFEEDLKYLLSSTKQQIVNEIVESVNNYFGKDRTALLFTPDDIIKIIKSKYE